MVGFLILENGEVPVNDEHRDPSGHAGYMRDP